MTFGRPGARFAAEQADGILERGDEPFPFFLDLDVGACCSKRDSVIEGAGDDRPISLGVSTHSDRARRLADGRDGLRIFWIAINGQGFTHFVILIGDAILDV